MRASRLDRGRMPIAAALAASGLIFASLADACTRVVYLGKGQQVVTARSMDWQEDIQSDLWVFPRGMARNGEAGPNSLQWQSKYGSVITSAYGVATTDGVNEAGLAANLLWLVESQYPAFGPASKPGLTIAAWGQYILDNFATVQEAVAAMEKEPYTIVTDKVPGQNRNATLHLSISDATGDSAIVEYIGGKQVIHHGRQFQVMTNSPTFDQQLALNSYWQQIGGTVMLPGTNRAADRFARASFYTQALPKFDDPDIGLAAAFSVIRNASVPYGFTLPDQPNISSTRWRTVIDHRRRMYFFESALTPNTFWVDLKKLDLSAKTGQVMMLALGENQRNVFAGETSGKLKPAKPFQFLGLAPR